uniref:CHK kinase-like domain-containing protein n=2 Tax=Ceratitis capitata TaxID=7213 RepID=W8BS47_CERCA
MPPKPEEYNEDELQPPQWLDAEYMTKVLCNAERNTTVVEVKNFKITPAAVKGDHYASIMFRAAVEYSADGEHKNKSMIIKTMPEAEGHKKDMLKQMDIFEVEIGMYTRVLPRFEKYLRDVGDETKLMVPFLYHELTPHKVIVFEDIVPLGYNVMRARFPNPKEVKAAYAKLAKWHGISYKLLKEDPHFFDEYRNSIFSHDSAKENTFFANSTKAFMNFVHKTPELQEYVPHLENLFEKVNLLDETISSFREYRDGPREDAYYVLNHGDYHLKNMMFKHNTESGKFEDVMLLDFQFSHVGPITSDLIYSIFMFLDDKLRPQAPEFLHHYFATFKETLKKIGFEGPMPSLNKFREQLFHSRYVELFIMITFLPMWPKFIRGEFSPDTFASGEDYHLKIFDKEYVDELLQILPNYLHLGYFEV